MTVAGIGERGYSGDGGPATGAWLYHPREVAVDNTGALYIAERRNHRIRRVDKAGRITTVAGNGERGYGGDGAPAAGAWLYGPTGVAVDSSGALYIVDSENHRIRRVDKAGRITTVAGNGERGYGGDGGPAAGATLYYPYGLAVGNTGNLYIADTWNHRIRRVDVSGTITTVAGIGEGSDSGGSGPAADAVLHYPQGVAVDGSGNVYIADTVSHRIRRVDTSGTLTTIAGTGQGGFGGDGGPAMEAQLNYPTGVAVDEAGNIYVADSGNHRIRVLTQLPPPPGAPTRLTATAVSPFRIDLSWRDNSDEEEGFRVQRRVEGSSQWVDIGTTAANVTAYSDTGLEPTTTLSLSRAGLQGHCEFGLLERGRGDDPESDAADPDAVHADKRTSRQPGHSRWDPFLRRHRRGVQRSPCGPVRGGVGDEDRGRGASGGPQRPDQGGGSGGRRDQRRVLHGDRQWNREPAVRAHRAAVSGTDTGIASSLPS